MTQVGGRLEEKIKMCGNDERGWGEGVSFFELHFL